MAGPLGTDGAASDLALLAAAAAEGAAIAMRHWRRDPEVWFKDGGSPVSEADLAVDRTLREILLGARPDYGWVSEESAPEERLRCEDGLGFVLDPIDGTRAFLEGRRSWGVAIAVIDCGRPVAGVLACPALGHDYAATLGGGATRDGEAIGVNAASDRPRMAGPRAWLNRMPDGYGERIEKAPYVPSLALRIAMVAEGSLDGTYIRASAKDWDLAAADLVLTEAGGALCREDGGPPVYGHDNARHGLLVAGSAAQLPHMLDMVRRVAP